MHLFICIIMNLSYSDLFKLNSFRMYLLFLYFYYIFKYLLLVI